MYQSWRRLKRLLTISIFLFAANGDVSAQGNVRDLASEIDAGHVWLLSAMGTGRSSGSSIEGHVVNQTAVEVHVDVYLARPIYLVNRGHGQNMVAAQVYLGGGRYRSSGGRSFITLRPRERTEVRFVAYCVDFDKENPTPGEGFSIGDIPANLMRVMANIRSYVVTNPDSDVTVAAQVAIWLAQGESAEEIQAKFPFTATDATLAGTFIR